MRWLLIVAALAISCAPDDPCDDSDDWQCFERYCWALTDTRAPVCEPEDVIIYNPYNHCLIETNGPGDDVCGRWYGRDRGGEWGAR